MEQNNNDVAEQKINLEYTNLVETMDVKTQKDITGQQSLAELGSHVQHNNTIPEHQSKQSSVRDIIGPPCQSQIQFASSSTSNQGNHEDDATSQNLKVQQSVTQTQCAADNIDIKVEPVIDSVKNIAIESQTGNNSLKSSTLQSVPSSSQANSAVEQSNESNESILNLSNSQVTTATMPKISVTQENETTKSPHIQTISKSTPKSNVTVYTKDSNDYTKLADRSKSFRAAEFVLNNLDSAPGEERFYSWSNKTKNFASIQLTKETREKFYAQKINSNVTNSHSDQSTVVADNEQQQTNWQAVDHKFQGSDSGPSPISGKKMNKGKSSKQAAERDRILKKYSRNLMRKKPRSWQPQERSTDEVLSSDI